MMGKNDFFTSLISSCFRDNIRARKTINDSFAKSDVWNVIPIPGMVNQRLAWFTLLPKAKVNSNKGIVIPIKILEIPA
jgi:phenylalanine-4-hydroxylase